MLTPKDLENPARKSGYDHVGFEDVPGRPKPYRASAGKKAKAANGGWDQWIGPHRATALEAAQDYCDWYNGQPVTPATQNYPSPVIDMGNITEHQPKQTGGRAPKLVDGPRDLYDVLFYDVDTGLVVRRKIGITARGLSRYTGICKMLGLSLKPNAEPVTLPSESAARIAEDALVASICKDKAWKRVGKECFAPIGKVKA